MSRRGSSARVAACGSRGGPDEVYRAVPAEFVAMPGGEQEVAGEFAEAGGEIGFIGV